MSQRLPASACTTMAEVRAGVDSIDRALIALIAERMTYMDAAARIKPERGQVRDEARKAAVIGNAMADAAARGVDPGLVRQMWEYLVEGSIAREFTEWDRLRAGEQAHGASDGARTRDLRRDRPAL